MKSEYICCVTVNLILMTSSCCLRICVTPLSLVGNGPYVSVFPFVTISSSMRSVYAIIRSQSLLYFVFIQMFYSLKKTKMNVKTVNIWRNILKQNWYLQIIYERGVEREKRVEFSAFDENAFIVPCLSGQRRTWTFSY